MEGEGRPGEGHRNPNERRGDKDALDGGGDGAVREGREEGCVARAHGIQRASRPGERACRSA